MQPTAAPAPVSPAAPVADQPSVKDLRKAAEGFEEMFLVFMLRAARAGGVGDQIAGSSAVSSTRDMLDAQLARTAAEGTRLGIAEAVARQFTRPGQGE